MSNDFCPECGSSALGPDPQTGIRHCSNAACKYGKLPHEIERISKDGGSKRLCRCGQIISLNRKMLDSKGRLATDWLAQQHVERGNAYAKRKVTS